MSEWQAYAEEDYDKAGFGPDVLISYKPLMESIIAAHVNTGVQAGAVVSALNTAFREDGLVPDINTKEDLFHALQAFEDLDGDHSPRF